MIKVADGADVTLYFRHFQEYGYAIIPSILDQPSVGLLRKLRARVVDDWKFANGLMVTPDAVGGMLERSPCVILPIVTHPVLLGFAEAVMGPVVQLDSAVLAGDPPVAEAAVNGPVMWHRDRFGSVPPAAYLKPASVVFIAYLQRMTPEMGQLRVLPGSHRQPDRIETANLCSDIQGEVRIEVAAGDVVALHHNLLHSGGQNTHDRDRMFFGFIYNASMLRQEDNFDGPNCRALRDAAQRCHDRRLLRLLGDDPLIFPRQNSGFTGDEAADWATWVAEDEVIAAEYVDDQDIAERIRLQIGKASSR